MEQVNTTTPSAGMGAGVPDISQQFSGEYLSFNLGGEEYGIDILKVQEIRGYEQPTRMAGASDFVKGVMNLRGVIVPIIDLRIKFGLPQVNYGAQTVTVILALTDLVVGVVVDSVSDVVELSADEIKPAPGLHGNVDSTCITGIGTIKQNSRERMLILINIETLMSSASMGLMRDQLQ